MPCSRTTLHWSRPACRRVRPLLSAAREGSASCSCQVLTTAEAHRASQACSSRAAQQLRQNPAKVGQRLGRGRGPGRAPPAPAAGPTQAVTHREQGRAAALSGPGSPSEQEGRHHARRGVCVCPGHGAGSRRAPLARPGADDVPHSKAGSLRCRALLPQDSAKGGACSNA